MKRIIIIVMAILFVFTGVVFAGSMEMGNEVTVGQGQGQSIDQDFSSHGNSYGGINPMQLSNLHGVFASPIMPDGIGNWKVWSLIDKRIEIGGAEIDGFRNKSKKIERFITWPNPTASSQGITLLADDSRPINCYDIKLKGRVHLISYVPYDSESLGYEVAGIGKDRGGAVAFIVYRALGIKKSDMEGKGGAIGGGTPFGSLTDRSILSYEFSAGKGSSIGVPIEGYEFQAWFYDRVPPAECTAKKEEKVQKIIQPASKEVKEVVQETVQKPAMEPVGLPTIYYDTDEYVIKDKLKENPEAVDQIAKKDFVVNYILSDIQNPGSKWEYLINGMADERHTEEHNIELGYNRAISVCRELKKEAEKRQIPREVIKDRIKCASLGEGHAFSPKLKYNRAVVVYRGEMLSQILQ